MELNLNRKCLNKQNLEIAYTVLKKSPLLIWCNLDFFGFTAFVAEGQASQKQPKLPQGICSISSKLDLQALQGYKVLVRFFQISLMCCRWEVLSYGGGMLFGRPPDFWQHSRIEINIGR